MAHSKDLMQWLEAIKESEPKVYVRMLAAATVVCEYGSRGEPTEEQASAWHELTLVLRDYGLVTGKGGHLRFAHLVVACASA